MSRIVISGTYCTGKTTLTLALEKATGISATHALTMREILPNLYPGISLRECSFTQLLSLGMKRFEDRIRKESNLNNSFISDGCPLQEWLYGSTRLITGAYPDETHYQMEIKKLRNWKEYKNFKILLKGFEGMAKEYTKNNYDLFFHLPVEFPFVEDGHRPTSENFRRVSEERLLNTYRDLDINPTIINGNLHERINKILNHIKVKPAYPIDKCIEYAYSFRRNNFDSIHLENKSIDFSDKF